MNDSFTFVILTPDTIFYEGEISSLVAPAVEGSFGVLSHHAPLVSRSDGGKVKVREISKKERFFEVGPGLVEVFKNRVVLLTKHVLELSGN